MTAFDEPRTLNTDHLITVIYQIQTSLKILAEQLARDRNPDYSDITLYGLEVLHRQLQGFTPSLTRH